MVIRNARLEDEESLVGFYKGVIDYLLDEDHINYANWSYYYPNKFNIKRNIIRNEQFIMMENNKVVGAFFLGENRESNYSKGKWSLDLSEEEYLVLDTFALSPSKINKGKGQLMLKFAVNYAKRNNKKAVRLDVIFENEPAKKMLLKGGFKFVGKAKKVRFIEGVTYFALYEYNLFTAD
jgi:GNAT superfamily N-acetyltransferase